MSYNTLPPAVQEIAERALTPKQLHVLKLHLAGCGQRRISDMLGVSRRTVRTHLDDAHHRLRKAGVQVDAAGRYYTQEAA